MFDFLVVVFEIPHRKPCTGGFRLLKGQRVLSAAEEQGDRGVHLPGEQPDHAGARRVSSAHTRA